MTTLYRDTLQGDAVQAPDALSANNKTGQCATPDGLPAKLGGYGEGGDLAEWLRRLIERGGDDAPAVLGILGSSRSDGNTAALVRAVFSQLDDAALVDLNGLSVAPYDYDHRHEGDDFAPLAHAMAKARAIVFASPVYWYSMSAPMKTFFDRLTDLTEPHKPLGKALAGKTAFLIATGASPAPPAAFEYPFAQTARYFNMRWGGTLYGLGSAPAGRAAQDFARQVKRTVTALQKHQAQKTIDQI